MIQKAVAHSEWAVISEPSLGWVNVYREAGRRKDVTLSLIHS